MNRTNRTSPSRLGSPLSPADARRRYAALALGAALVGGGVTLPLMQACSGAAPGAVQTTAQAATGPLSAPFATVVSAGSVVAPPAGATSAAVDRVASGTFTGTASFKVWWDASYLGVEAVFADNAPPTIDSTNLWDDDSIELYVDADANKGTSYDAKDRQFVITVGKALWEQGGRTTGVITSATASGNTITTRFAIPWTNLGIAPAPNAWIGLDVGVNDDDNGGARDGQAMSFGTANNWSDTSAWGVLQLN